MRKALPLLGVLLFLFASCGKHIAPVVPVARAPEAAPPGEGDYQQDLIAQLMAKIIEPAALPGGVIPDVEVEAISGGPAISLATLAKPGSISALVFYTTNEDARDAITLLLWLRESGLPLELILVDVGTDSFISGEFARHFAGTLPVYRLRGSQTQGLCGIVDSAAQLPIVHYVRADPKAYAYDIGPFGADTMLRTLALPELLGDRATERRVRLVKSADRPGAALMEEYFRLWDIGRCAQARFIAEQIPSVRSGDNLAMLVWANAICMTRGDEVSGYMAANRKKLGERLPVQKGVEAGMNRYVSAKLAMRGGDYQTAAEMFQGSIEDGMGKQVNRAWFQRGRALQFATQTPEAVLAYRKSIALGFENVDCYHFLGECIDNDADKQPALDVYDHALTFAPWMGELYYHRGQTLHAMGRHEEAVEAWLRGAAADIKYSRTLEEAGNCLLWHLKRDQDAFAVLREAIRRRGEIVNDWHGANLWNNFGMAAFLTGERALAIASYLESIRAQKDQPFAYGNLGQAYEALGRGNNAIWAYEQGLANAPKSPRAAVMKASLDRLKNGGAPDTGLPTPAVAPVTPASSSEPPVKDAH